MTARKKVTIHTRGIASPAGGAYGVLLSHGDCRKDLSGGEAGASNNRMDLLSAVEGLRALKPPCQVVLYNTNSYLTDGMSKGWARRWRENGWRTEADKPTAHADLWDMLLKLCAIHEVEFVWLPASAQIADYEQCDRLARQVLASQIRRIIEDRD
ncbi:MAG TPA: RNase H family protein [Gemmataceae bacterium]|nr:RNase H family protein [Gemmataceae bacterium]